MRKQTPEKQVMKLRVPAKERLSQVLNRGLETWEIDSLFKVPIISYGEGNGTPLQYSCLENSMDGGAW